MSALLWIAIITTVFLVGVLVGVLSSRVRYLASLVKLKSLEQTDGRLREAFAAMSATALQNNSQQFMDVARSLFDMQASKNDQLIQERLTQKETTFAQAVKNVQTSLEQVDHKIVALEKSREGAYEGLLQQVKTLNENNKELRDQTHQLVNALRSPNVRGRWGEIQLKRVMELAGMLAHCDFQEQVSIGSEVKQRPDVVVRLPGNKSLVIDAKVPLDSYLSAAQATDPAMREKFMLEHVASIKRHMLSLGQKAYWQNFELSPEFIILFIPGEAFYSAALDMDPTLIENGSQQKVILATPTTLISVLKTVALVWRQEQFAQNAQEISALGQELYKRLDTLGKYTNDLGSDISRTINSFNKLVGTLDSRVLSTARKFLELGVVSEQSPNIDVKSITETPRQSPSS